MGREPNTQVLGSFTLQNLWGIQQKRSVFWFRKMRTLVTRIEEVLRIAVMGGKFFHVMLPLEDMAEFMDANMV